MYRLKNAEKREWQERIGARVQHGIEQLKSIDPYFVQKINEEAQRRANQDLGILESREKIAAITETIQQLHKQREELESSMWNIAFEKYPKHSRGDGFDSSRFNYLFNRLRRKFKAELLNETPHGRQIQSLREERDSLADTISLAHSITQMRNLWSRLSAMIGEGPTELQQRILASATDEQKPE